MRLLLIDGHYYVYRSYFAILHLSNSHGEPTNAIFGFTKTLRLMLKHLQPDLGAVVWDEGVPQRRVELQPAYKETRKEMPKPMILWDVTPSPHANGTGWTLCSQLTTRIFINWSVPA